MLILFCHLDSSSCCFCEASFTAAGVGGGLDTNANPTNDNDGYDSYFSDDDDDDVSESFADVEQTPSPNKNKTPMKTPFSNGKRGKAAAAQSYVTGVHVSKKKFTFGGVSGYYYAISCLLPSGLVTSNDKTTLMNATSNLKSRILDSRTGLIEVVIPKPKEFFKSSTFKSTSKILHHFFGQDDESFKHMIGSQFDHDKEIMYSMNADIKTICLHDEVDENITTKGCSFLPSSGIALYTVLIKARDKKVLSEDEADIDLFACESSPIFTPSPSHSHRRPPPSPHHPHQQPSQTSAASENVKRADAENAFLAVAEEIRKRDVAAQQLARELEELRLRMGSIEATSPSSDQRSRKISRTNSTQHPTSAPPVAVSNPNEKPASVQSMSSADL
jgi:hypothetical protein